MRVLRLAYDRTFEFDHEEKLLLSKLPNVLFHRLSAFRTIVRLIANVKLPQVDYI